jgi:hypothetical protein
MVLLVIDVCTCTTALATVILTTFNIKYLYFLKSVSLVFGAFACDLLLLILVPPFGWFIFIIWVFVLVCLLYGKSQHILQCYQEILPSISHSTSHAFNVLCNWFQEILPSISQFTSHAFNVLCNGFQKILPSISHSTSHAFNVLCIWFQENFLSRSIWRTPSQASNGSDPTQSSNVPKEEVVVSTPIVSS